MASNTFRASAGVVFLWSESGSLKLIDYCNSPSLPLADIVLFGLSLSGYPSRFFKTRLLGRGFHILIKGVSFSSLSDVGSHNPPPLGPSILAGTCCLLQLMWDPQSTPFGAQSSCWHTALCPPPLGLSLSLLAGTLRGV